MVDQVQGKTFRKYRPRSLAWAKRLNCKCGTDLVPRLKGSDREADLTVKLPEVVSRRSSGLVILAMHAKVPAAYWSLLEPAAA